MPTPRTLAEVLVDVEALLAAVALNAETLPDLDVIRAPLDASLVQLKVLATRRDNFKAEKQVIVQQMREVKSRILDSAADLRSLLKGNLGRRNEKLTEFRVAPNRGGKKRKGTGPAESRKPPAAPAAPSGVLQVAPKLMPEGQAGG